MNTRKVKLILLSAILSVAVSLLTVGYLTARPGDSHSGAVAGTLTITGGFERPDKARFYSDKTSVCSGGCNIVRGTVRDADLGKKRTGTVVYIGINAAGNPEPIFTILRGDGVSTGANVVGVLQGETSATRKFSGDNSSVVFPLTTTFGTITPVAARGVSVIALGRTVLDGDGSGSLTGVDVRVTNGGVTSTADFVTPTGDAVTVLA